MSKKDHPHLHGNQEKKDSEVNEKHEAAAGEIERISYEELETKLNEAEAKANENWDKYLRSQAEMQNVRQRLERDISNAHKYGNEKLIMELLPMIDGIERGLAMSEPNEAVKNMHEGMSMALNMLLKTLEKFGVKQVNPMGEVFNPTWHQAISTKEDAKAKSGEVLEVLQKGYTLQDRLLRPALVVVAK